MNPVALAFWLLGFLLGYLLTEGDPVRGGLVGLAIAVGVTIIASLID